MSDDVKKQGRGYDKDTVVQKASTLKAQTDRVYNVVDAATPEADTDAHGIPAATSKNYGKTLGDKKFYSTRKVSGK